METEETKLNSETKGKIVEIFSHFMERVAKFDELTAAGNIFLVNFRQGLEFIRRPSIDKTSDLFEKIIKANNNDRIQSYIKAGYTHTSSMDENFKKFNTSHNELLDIASKAKDIMNELELLVEDVNLALEATYESLKKYNPDLNLIEEENVSFGPEKHEDVNYYANIVAIVYSMVKQDYVMQEKIVSRLDSKISSGELESYCLMWSLRPFVDDKTMLQAWKLNP